MFRKLSALVAGVLLATPLVFAQGRPVEIFAGYSNLQSEGLPIRNTPDGIFDTDFLRDRSTQHGFNASLSGFGESGLGITGDFSFGRQKAERGPESRKTDTNYFLAGPAVKWNRNGSSRAEPFVRVMAGAAHTNFEAARTLQSSSGTFTSSFEAGATDFAAAAGGGLDIRLSENVKLRAIQFDYAPIFLRDRTIDILGGTGALQPSRIEKQRQDNFRFSFGLVF